MWPQTLRPVVDTWPDVEHVQGIHKTAAVAAKLAKIEALGFSPVQRLDDQLFGSPAVANCRIGIVGAVMCGRVVLRYGVRVCEFTPRIVIEIVADRSIVAKPGIPRKVAEVGHH